MINKWHIFLKIAKFEVYLYDWSVCHLYRLNCHWFNWKASHINKQYYEDFYLMHPRLLKILDLNCVDWNSHYVQWIHTIHVKQAWKKSFTFFVMLYMIQISVKGRNLINSNLTPAICTGTAMLLSARYIYIGSANLLKFSLNFDKVGDDPLLNHSQGHISKNSCLIHIKIAWFQAVFSIAAIT